MLNLINRAELVALLIVLRHCRPGVTESIAYMYTRYEEKLQEKEA